MQKKVSLQDINVITALSDSRKSKVYLVSMENTPDKLAIFKKYQGTDMVESCCRIENLKSEYFPKVYAVWEENGETLLLEEYISGETLQDKLDAEVLLQEKDITFYMQELCGALHVLHNAVPPIIHRDVKPENVIVTKAGKVKLLDFDASREYGEDKERDTVLLGTKEYASPEQFGFMQTDVRSDIYSWGVVYSELLGHAQVNKKYAKKARKIINRATMFDPEKRYSDTETVMRDVQQFKRSEHPYRIPVLSAIGVAVISVACVMVMKESPQEGNVAQQSSIASLESEQENVVESKEELVFPLESKPIEVVSLAEAYNYVSIEEEVQAKHRFIMETRSDLYHGFVFDDNDSGVYSATQETVIGNQYEVLRFLKAYPRDIVVHDNRFEGKVINNVSYCPYLEDVGIDGSRQFLEAKDYAIKYGNVLSISADCLQTLEPGAYTFTMEIGKDADGLLYGFYLVVHGAEEHVDNFRVHTLNEIAYYSSESRNDVVFYVNNTPYPIQAVWANNAVLNAEEYQLVDDGFGVVLHPDFLEQYEEQDRLELLIKTANGKWVRCRVIYLKHF